VVVIEEVLKGRCQFVTALLDRGPPSYTASRATAWESYASLHLGKQVSHVEPDSASQDGLDWMLGESLQSGR